MKPTKPGFYWYKIESVGFSEAGNSITKYKWKPVEVLKDYGGLVVIYPGTDEDDYVSDTKDSDWGEEIKHEGWKGTTIQVPRDEMGDFIAWAGEQGWWCKGKAWEYDVPGEVYYITPVGLGVIVKIL